MNGQHQNQILVGITPHIFYSYSCSPADLLCFMSMSILREQELSFCTVVYVVSQMLIVISCSKGLCLISPVQEWVCYFHQGLSSHLIHHFSTKKDCNWAVGKGNCTGRVRFSNSFISCKTEDSWRLACNIFFLLKKHISFQTKQSSFPIQFVKSLIGELIFYLLPLQFSTNSVVG